MRYLVFAFASVFAFAQAAPKALITSELGGKEMAFLHRANEQTLELIYLAGIGKEKGSSESIRALGDLLGTTCGKELDQLLALGVTKGISFPAGQPGMVKRLQTQLEAAKPADFDTAWLAEISAVTKASIQNYSSGITVSDEEIKKFAEAGLALANQKLEVIEKVARK